MGPNLSLAMTLSLKDMISSPLKGITRIVDGVGDAADKASRKFTRWSNQTATLTKDLKKIGEFGKPIAAVGVAGAIGIGYTIKKFADLEDAQNALKVNSMDAMGRVGADYKKMLDLGARLGVELPGDTKDMVEMFIAMREQGISAKEILGGMGEAAAKFKVVMGGDSFAGTAQSVAQLSVAMGVTGKDSIKFMDILQRLKSTSGLTIGDMTDTMKYLAPSLKALKLQGIGAGQDVGAVLGMMKQSGLDSSVAGTSLAMALTRSAEIDYRKGHGVVKKLVGPLLDQKGIKLNFFDSSGSFQGMRSMIGELEKLKALSSKDQLLVLTKLFGQEAAKPMAVFVGQGVAGFDKMTRQMAAQASMSLKINTIMGSTSKLWETMTGTMDTFIMTAGAGFSDILGLPDKLIALNKIFGGMNDWMLANPKTAKVVGMVVVGVTGLALGVGGLAMGLGTVGHFLPTFLSGLAALSRVAPLVGGSLRFIGVALNLLRVAFLTNPIGLAVTGIAVAAFLIYKYWGPITKFFSGILKSVLDIAGRMREAGVKIVTMLWEGIKSMAMKPVEAIKGIVQKIRNHLPFSPAKEGPLRDLHRIRIVETIAQTIKPGPMAAAMRRATAATMMAAAIPGGAGMAGGITVNYHQEINIPGGSSAEVREQVKQANATSQKDFERMLQRVLNDQQRRRF